MQQVPAGGYITSQPGELGILCQVRWGLIACCSCALGICVWVASLGIYDRVFRDILLHIVSVVADQFIDRVLMEPTRQQVSSCGLCT